SQPESAADDPSDEQDVEIDDDAEAAAEQLRSLDLQHGEPTEREKKQAEELRRMQVRLNKAMTQLSAAQRAVVKTGKELQESKATIVALNKVKSSQGNATPSPNRKRKNAAAAADAEESRQSSQSDSRAAPSSSSSIAPVTQVVGAQRQLLFTPSVLLNPRNLFHNPLVSNTNASQAPIPQQVHAPSHCLVATGLGLQASAQINEVASAFGALLKRAGVVADDLPNSEAAAMLPVYVFKLGQASSGGHHGAARAISWKLVFRDAVIPANILRIYNGNDPDGVPLVPEELKWNG